MTVTNENLMIEYLDGLSQADWDAGLENLMEFIHPVDQQATRIWFRLWPLKLARVVKDAKDLPALERDLRLRGRYRLEEQLVPSLGFFYGAYYLNEVSKAMLAGLENLDETGEIEDEIGSVAFRAAASASVEPSLLVGVGAAVFMALRQIGLPAFYSALKAEIDGSSQTRQRRIPSPETVLKERARQRKGGFFGFLKSVDRRFQVTFDEKQRDAFFQAIHGQDLSMASASDRRDYQTQDIRRIEGPIPYECRSGSCGHCWIGILGGGELLSELSEYELKRLQYFGYAPKGNLEEVGATIRLACQTSCYGDVSVVIPPWNGMLDGRD